MKEYIQYFKTCEKCNETKHISFFKHCKGRLKSHTCLKCEYERSIREPKTTYEILRNYDYVPAIFKR